jgi:hypothetical protein
MVSEAPKKIWRVEQNGYASGPDVLYIRADLVDGLVEVVEAFTNGKFDSDEFDAQIEMMEDALAALKALEEPNGN